MLSSADPSHSQHRSTSQFCARYPQPWDNPITVTSCKFPVRASWRSSNLCSITFQRLFEPAVCLMESLVRLPTVCSHSCGKMTPCFLMSYRRIGQPILAIRTRQRHSPVYLRSAHVIYSESFEVHILKLAELSKHTGTHSVECRFFSSLVVQVTSNMLKIEYIAPLMKLVFTKADDVDIWTTVFDLVARTKPIPQPTTSPQSHSLFTFSFQQTP